MQVTVTIDANGARRLVAALVARAVRDAQRGDTEARCWLAGPGADLADLAFDIAPDRVMAWAGMIPASQNIDI